MIQLILDALSEKDEGYWLRTDEKMEFYDNVAHVLFLLKSAVEKSAVQKAAVEDENNH